MELQDLIIIGMGVWRLTALVVTEDGPFDMFIRLRERVGIVEKAPGKFVVPAKFSAKVLSCVWCASIWFGLAAFGAWSLWPQITLSVMAAFAISTVAIIVNRFAA